MFMDCVFIDCKWPYGGIELAQLSTTLVVLDNEKKYCLESLESIIVKWPFLKDNVAVKASFYTVKMANYG